MIERDWLDIEQAKRITSRDRTARISEAHTIRSYGVNVLPAEHSLHPSMA